MSKQKQYFGTDGIRGEVGSSLINPEFVLKLGWAIGKVLANGTQLSVLIGKDTRISGYLLESALEAGLSAAGTDIHLLGPMPTPAIAYLTRTLRAKAGIVISASHNHYKDNGIKLFSAEGTKLPDEIELAIEAQMQKPLTTVAPAELGKAMRIKDAPGRYIEFCKSTIPSRTRFNDLKIVIDCANGATYHVAPEVYRELGADVITLGTEPDGFNINEACGSTHPDLLQEAVLQHKADLGIAYDGDGDRVIMIDDSGEIVDGDELLYIICKERRSMKTPDPGVVGTLMSNFGLEVALKKLGVDFIRAQVGDRYVMQTLKERNWLLGGEASGHIVCLDKTSTGDGIVSSLQVCHAIIANQQALSQLKTGMEKYPQKQINIKTTNAQTIMEHSKVKQAVAQIQGELNGSGRVVLRPSGTEPLIRVMVEGQDFKKVETLAQQLADVVMQIA